MATKKVQAVAAALLVAVSGILMVTCQTPPSNLEKIMQTCRERTKITDDVMRNFIVNGMREQDATDAVKCHIACIMEQQGDLKDGVFNSEAVANGMKSLPPFRGRAADVDAVVNKCKGVRGVNDCDTAFKIAMCFKELKAK